MSPKPFSWAKNRGKLFLDEKSRGLLLARAALKFAIVIYVFNPVVNTKLPIIGNGCL